MSLSAASRPAAIAARGFVITGTMMQQPGYSDELHITAAVAYLPAPGASPSPASKPTRDSLVVPFAPRFHAEPIQYAKDSPVAVALVAPNPKLMIKSAPQITGMTDAAKTGSVMPVPADAKRP